MPSCYPFIRGTNWHSAQQLTQLDSGVTVSILFVTNATEVLGILTSAMHFNSLNTHCVYAIITNSNAEWPDLNGLELQRQWGRTGLSNGKGVTTSYKKQTFINIPFAHMQYAVCIHTHMHTHVHALSDINYLHFKAHKTYVQDIWNQYNAFQCSVPGWSCSLLVVRSLLPLSAVFVNMDSF